MNEEPTEDEMSAMEAEHAVRQGFQTLLDRGLVATAWSLHEEMDVALKLARKLRELKEKDAA